MNRVFHLFYAVVSYLAFLASFLAMMAATLGIDRFGVRAIDGPPRHAPVTAAVIDLGLIAAFGLQHSVMARRGFKAALGRWLPSSVERNTFVLASALAVAAIVLGWSPIAGRVWSFDGLGARWALHGLSLLGYALTVASSFAIDHFELFGLKQGWAAVKGGTCEAPAFRVPLLYRWVRHPMQLGILIAVWAAPRMSWGHVLFATALTGYIFVGLAFEERDLVRRFGDQYARYRAAVPALLPWPRPKPVRQARPA